MNLKLDPKSAVLGAVLVLSGALAADQLPSMIPYVFKAGDPVRSAEVNANFASLGTAVEGLQGAANKPITTERLAEDSVTASKLKSLTFPVDGRMLGYEGGQLVWKDVSPGKKIYKRITARGAQVPGDITPRFSAACDSPADVAIGGMAQYTGGESRQYLRVVSSYADPNRQNAWVTDLGNDYGDGANANSIIYVDIGVVCVRP